MKKLAFILLAVGLPLAVTGLANPSGVTINGWPAAPTLALGPSSSNGWLSYPPGFFRPSVSTTSLAARRISRSRSVRLLRPLSQTVRSG